MSIRSNHYPRVGATIAAIIFGFSFIFTKNALDYLEPFQLIGIRFLVAALIMTFLKTIGVLKIDIKTKNMKALILVALLQPVIYFIFETLGVDLTTASESGIIISLVPISITIFARLLLKEKLKIIQWVSIFISVSGAILIIFPHNNSQSSRTLLGLLFLFGAVLSAGLYNVFSRKVSTKYSPGEVTYVMMWVGALTFNFVGISQGMINHHFIKYFSALADFHVVLDIGYLGILSSIVAFFLLNSSLSKMEASKVGVFMNITPIVSVAAGVFLRGERFYLPQIIGSVIVLIGLWGVNRNNEDNRREGYV